jgi:hemerythrin
VQRDNKDQTENNEIETKRTMQSIKQSWFFEKINKIDKPIAKLTKRMREKIQISKIREKRG